MVAFGVWWLRFPGAVASTAADVGPGVGLRPVSASLRLAGMTLLGYWGFAGTFRSYKIIEWLSF